MVEQTLSGETALVTGAAKRIGRAIALELARAGADVAVHVNHSVEEGAETAHAVEALGRRAAVVRADQSDVKAIERAIRDAEGRLGSISILVNNAAIWPQMPLEAVDPAAFDETLAINLRGPFFWARALGLAMKQRGRGSIVSIADVSTDRPWTDAVPYCMAKAGIVSMTYGLAKALAPAVRVNAVGPGPIVFPPGYPEAEIEKDRRSTLRGREGSPEDVARAVRFLCESPNITGILLPVDGGYRFGI